MANSVIKKGQVIRRDYAYNTNGTGIINTGIDRLRILNIISNNWNNAIIELYDRDSEGHGIVRLLHGDSRELLTDTRIQICVIYYDF